jgi:hypothetical protein
MHYRFLLSEKTKGHGHSRSKPKFKCKAPLARFLKKNFTPAACIGALALVGLRV